MDLRQLSCWKGYIIFTYMQHGRPDRILGLQMCPHSFEYLHFGTDLWSPKICLQIQNSTKYDNPQPQSKMSPTYLGDMIWLAQLYFFVITYVQ